MNNIRTLTIARVPQPTGDPFLDSVEMAILRNLAESIDFEREGPLHQAVGLAMARTLYLRAQGDAEAEVRHPGRFVASAMIVLRKMSDRQRGKLRHPARNRAEMQTLLDGVAL